jgi:hypothetical protein
MAKARDPSRCTYQHLVDEDGNFISRSDVKVVFPNIEAEGDLTVGFG